MAAHLGRARKFGRPSLRGSAGMVGSQQRGLALDRNSIVPAADLNRKTPRNLGDIGPFKSLLSPLRQGRRDTLYCKQIGDDCGSDDEIHILGGARLGLLFLFVSPNRNGMMVAWRNCRGCGGCLQLRNGSPRSDCPSTPSALPKTASIPKFSPN